MSDVNFITTYRHGFPEKNEFVLDSDNYGLICKLNREGSQLAVGGNDGNIIIWDAILLSIVSTIHAHVHPITSLCWSRRGHLLLSGSSDWSTAIIDSERMVVLRRIFFSSSVFFVEFNPRNDDQFLVCCHREFPKVFSISKDSEAICADEEPLLADSNPIASFDRRGQFIYMENARGKIKIFDSSTLKFYRQFFLKISGAIHTQALGFTFSHRGKDDILVNCYDRTLRLYRCEEILNNTKNIEPIQLFQDKINKSLWRECLFTMDGEYVIAGTSRAHDIYIWERSSGGLNHILHGPVGENLTYLTCHPLKPIFYSISGGKVIIWQNTATETWGAYSPNFIDMEQNLMYVEKENDFDIYDEDAIPQNPEKPQNSEILETSMDDFIDILTKEKPNYCSSDEDGNEIHVYARTKIIEAAMDKVEYSECSKT